MLLLGAIEAVREKPFSLLEAEHCLSELAEWHSRFYMHTDELALGRLAAALREDPRFDNVQGLDNLAHVANFMRHPRTQYRDPLAEYVIQPEYVGCGHLCAMLTSPADYGVRLELVRHVILSFYRQMWHGSPSPHFVVLPGEHDEKAILVIDVPGEARGSTFVPSVRCGVLGESRSFVVHEPARRFLREEAMMLLVNSGAIHPDVDLDAVRAELQVRSEVALEATVAALAPHLPRIRVIFDPSSHEITVIK